jgi:hypothetical protein
MISSLNGLRAGRRKYAPGGRGIFFAQHRANIGRANKQHADQRIMGCATGEASLISGVRFRHFTQLAQAPGNRQDAPPDIFTIALSGDAVDAAIEGLRSHFACGFLIMNRQWPRYRQSFTGQFAGFNEEPFASYAV